MKRQLTITALLSGFSLVTGCSTPTPAYNVAAQSNQKASLVKYQSASFSTGGASSVSGLRHLGIRDTALSLGARGGLAWRAAQINKIVKCHEAKLDLIYNFNALLLDKNVLPPVLIEGRHTFDQASDDVIRVADRAYTIQSQARFVSMAPTWRNYLIMNYPDPELPDISLLPRNDVEKNVWDRYVNQGWQAGITQADVIFAESLGRLKRDYEGMIRYHSLLQQRMVSKPFVAEMNLGITGGDSQMAINDRILRITTLPQFNIVSSEWEANLVTADNRQIPVEDEAR